MPLLLKGNQLYGLLLGLYSQPGYGKTKLVAALIKLLYEMTGKPTYYMAWDMQLDTSFPTGVVRDKHYHLIVADPMKDPIDEGQAMLGEARAGDYAAVVCDTMSSMAEQTFRSVTRKNIVSEDRKSKGKDQARATAQTDGGNQIVIPTMSDYMVAQTLMVQWLTSAVGLLYQGKHVVVLSHECMTDQGIGGPMVIGQALTETLPKWFQFTARIKMQRVGTGQDQVATRWLQVDNDGTYLAKDTLMALPPGGVRLGVAPPAGNATPEQLAQFEDGMLTRGTLIWKTLLQSPKARQNMEKGPQQLSKEQADAKAAQIDQEAKRLGALGREFIATAAPAPGDAAVAQATKAEAIIAASNAAASGTTAGGKA